MRKASLFLILLFASTVFFSFQIEAQQSPTRSRVVSTPTPSAKPETKQTQSSKPETKSNEKSKSDTRSSQSSKSPSSQSSKPEAKPTPPASQVKPTSSPTPPASEVKPTPSPSQQSTQQIQTLADLQAKIREIVARDSLKRSRIGLKIVSLDTGKTIFEEDADKFFMPASNMKNFTVATALEKLTPNFVFVTSVYATAKPDENGIINGDLIIYGRGDPTISFGIGSEDEIKGMEKLVEKIVSAGIKRIKGNLIGDESFFNGTRIPYTWEWEDLQWYYGAAVSSLTINDNAAKVVVTPASKIGEPATVQILPPESGLVVVNKTQTAETNSQRKIGIRRNLGTNILEVYGSIPINDKPYETFVSIPNPALTFVSILRSLLEKRGVVIEGKTETIGAELRRERPLLKDLVEIARLESPLLSLIAQRTMKPSQNLYTEILLRTLGENIKVENAKPEWTSADKGIAVVDKFLQEIGIGSGSVLMYDGSGLSRHNLVTPNAVANLYVFMKTKSRFSQQWIDSLTIAGVDGTLRSRFKGTVAERNVMGKTGTINQVSSLSGYVTSVSGERFVFSIIINNLPEQNLRISTIDEIVLLLANFNGKSSSVDSKSNLVNSNGKSN